VGIPVHLVGIDDGDSGCEPGDEDHNL